MRTPTDENPLGLQRIHHVEFWVGDARQSAYYYHHAFGFSTIAVSGLETGRRHSSSYALRQGEATFVFTAALDPAGPVARHVRQHGDGVRDITFEVEDADAAFHEAVRRGAEAAHRPFDLADEHGAVRTASIHAYGDTLHSFISTHRYAGPFLPRFAPHPEEGRAVGIDRVDHIVANVEEGRMDGWADWYQNVFGFTRYLTFDDKDISTDYSALTSVVMADGTRGIKLPINEPAPGRRRSQIQEFLDYYRSPGVQHIALSCGDIVRTLTALRDNGVEFLPVPAHYYDRLEERVGTIREPLETIRSLGLLVDRDDEGYLLQIFTRPVQDRPTLFYEIIQRQGSRGFGRGNFKALFQAIEAEQALRGNL